MHTILFLILFLLPDDNTKLSGKNDNHEMVKQTSPVVTTLGVIPNNGGAHAVLDTIPLEPIVSYKQTTPVITHLEAVGGPGGNTGLSSPGNTSGKTSTPQPASLTAQ